MKNLFKALLFVMMIVVLAFSMVSCDQVESLLKKDDESSENDKSQNNINIRRLIPEGHKRSM